MISPTGLMLFAVAVSVVTMIIISAITRQAKRTPVDDIALTSSYLEMMIDAQKTVDALSLSVLTRKFAGVLIDAARHSNEPQRYGDAVIHLYTLSDRMIDPTTRDVAVELMVRIIAASGPEDHATPDSVVRAVETVFGD